MKAWVPQKAGDPFRTMYSLLGLVMGGTNSKYKSKATQMCEKDMMSLKSIFVYWKAQKQEILLSPVRFLFTPFFLQQTRCQKAITGY